MPTNNRSTASAPPSPIIAPPGLGATRQALVLAEVAQAVTEIAAVAAPGAEVHGRVKTAQSRLLKEMRGGCAAMDCIGVRVIVTDVSHCFELIGQVHEAFRFLQPEYDDYIAWPKANGYRSLHTVLLHSSGEPVELQVRTREMHTAAVSGPAAHWLYKRASEEFRSTVDHRQVPTRFAIPFGQERPRAARARPYGDPESAAEVGA